MLNTTYTPKRALLKLLNPLKRLMDREASIKYIHYLMFFKYLSDQLEEHFTKIIENKNIMLFEAYEDEVYYDLFKKEAINNFGYFLDYDNLFNNILYENKDKRINIDNLSEAFNQISNTANSNIFKDVFDEIDLISPKLVKVNDEKEELLYYLMEIISKFGYNQEKSIKTLFDTSIDYYLNHIKKTWILAADRDVNKLLANIATLNNEEIESIYDPFLGTGVLLENVFQLTNNPSIYGQDINLTAYNMTIMNLIIHGVDYKKLNLYFGDTISNPGHVGKLFDIIVSVPPFGSAYKVPYKSIKNKERFGNLKIGKSISKLEFYIIMHMIYHLKEDGIIATIVNQSALTRNVDRNIKQFIIDEKNYLDAVINLPPQLFTDSPVPTSILIFKKNRSPDDKVLFINAEGECESQRKKNILKDENIDKIVNTYKTRLEIDKFSKLIDVKSIKENEFNLTISRYIDNYKGEYIELNEAIMKKEKLNQKLEEITEKIQDLELELNLK